MQDKLIIIRKYKKSHRRLNGGAWKIAYADFVTAMMALFLLMWLVNVAPEETKRGISEYFTTSDISTESSSAGTRAIEAEIFTTQSGDSDQETLAYNNYHLPEEKISEKDVQHADEVAREEKKIREITAKKLEKKKELQKVENTVREAFNSLKEVSEFKHNLIIELTDEGVKIQIVDSVEQEMFKSGSFLPVKVTEKIIRSLGGILTKLPNKIDITGHTDSKPYSKKEYGNWELSSDRAHSTRRILEESGVRSEQFSEVHGRADRDLLNKSNPFAPENRRVSITILYTDPQGNGSIVEKETQKNISNNMPKIIL